MKLNGSPCQLLAFFVLFLAGIGPASAVVVPFTEGFDTSASNWGGRSGLPDLDYVPAGGVSGGGYVSDQLNFELNMDGDSIVAFRAQDELNSSGHAFVGNWLTSGVASFSAWVRHSSPVPVNFFTRFSHPHNFPGATAVRFQPVFPNQWTQISFQINASNPAFVTFEGSDFNTIFANIGHVQVGFDVPTGFGGSLIPVTVDLDQAAILPEPGMGLGGLVWACAMLRRRPPVSS